tara:strand:- start:884 stop:1339 length:456 start_codon:yes stop_codon:yes gene_type:complete
MTKRKRTEKSKYKHQTTGDHCTCASYLAEMMCLRLAEYKNEGNLTYKFWNKKPWDWTFKQQMFTANSLIKTHGEKAVVRAVLQQKSVFSLKNKRLISEIYKQAKLIEQEENKPSQELDVKKEAKTRKKSHGKKSGLNKLRGLDNGKKESQE